MKLRVVGCLLCVGVLVLAGACSKKEEPAKPEPAKAAAPQAPALAKVKLALNWVAEPEFGGFYAARESGAYSRAGLDVEILGGGAGVPVVQMVATGQAEFGISGADEIITARARGVDVIPLFAAFQTSPQGLMVHASKGVKNIAELLNSGMTLAMGPGLPYAAYLKKKYGFGKVKIVPYDGGVARFVNDKDFAQQCFITSEPLAAKSQGSDPAVFLVADEGFNPYVTVVITRGALWRENPDGIRAFVRATRDGWRAYLDNPGPANAVMAKLNTTMDAATFTAVAEAQRPLIENAETKAKGLGAMTKERWETLTRQLVELGLIDKAPPVSDYLLPEFTAP